MDNKRVTLNNTFQEKDEIKQLNITKYYNRFRPHNNSRMNTTNTATSVINNKAYKT